MIFSEWVPSTSPSHLVHHFFLDHRSADLHPFCFEQREAHSPADEHRIDPRKEVLDDTQLVCDFGATKDDDIGNRRVAQEPTQSRELGVEQGPRIDLTKSAMPTVEA